MFDTLVVNESCTVKLLHIYKNQRTSLQSHANRSEMWFVAKGLVEVVVGNSTMTLKEGGMVMIPKNAAHRVMGVNDDNIVVEVSFGVFAEDDITRYSDDYDRK